jgi:hypothetical protein
MTAPAFGHVHSGLASAKFDLADAVVVDQRSGGTWAIFLDSSLARWEVFIDAPNGRVFTAPETWESLDGPALVQFEDDFIRAYRGSQTRELRVLRDEVYMAGARARAAQEGTSHAPEGDRLRALQGRADEAVTAAAGMHGAASAAQLQVFATRHAALVDDLTALEEELARVRSAVDLAASALVRVLA